MISSLGIARSNYSGIYMGRGKVSITAGVKCKGIISLGTLHYSLASFEENVHSSITRIPILTPRREKKKRGYNCLK